jgi:hypothetical protein
MRIVSLFAGLLLTGYFTYGQNLVGFNSKEIQKYMKENRLDMNVEKVTNNRFKYLKYSNNSDSQTLLFFFTNDSICKSVRLICDQRIKAEKVKEFDSIYKKIGKNRWIENRNGKNYHIEIREEEWSCIVTIEPDK